MEKDADGYGDIYEVEAMKGNVGCDASITFALPRMTSGVAREFGDTYFEKKGYVR